MAGNSAGNLSIREQNILFSAMSRLAVTQDKTSDKDLNKITNLLIQVHQVVNGKEVLMQMTCRGEHTESLNKNITLLIASLSTKGSKKDIAKIPQLEDIRDQLPATSRDVKPT